MEAHAQQILRELYEEAKRGTRYRGSTPLESYIYDDLRKYRSLEIIARSRNSPTVRELQRCAEALASGDTSGLDKLRARGLEYDEETCELYYPAVPSIRRKRPRIFQDEYKYFALPCPRSSLFHGYCTIVDLECRYIHHADVPIDPALPTWKNGKIIPARGIADVVKILPYPIFRELEPFLPVNIAKFLD